MVQGGIKAPGDVRDLYGTNLPEIKCLRGRIPQRWAIFTIFQ